MKGLIVFCCISTRIVAGRYCYSSPVFSLFPPSLKLKLECFAGDNERNVESNQDSGE